MSGDLVLLLFIYLFYLLVNYSVFLKYNSTLIKTSSITLTFWFIFFYCNILSNWPNIKFGEPVINVDALRTKIKVCVYIHLIVNGFNRKPWLQYRDGGILLQLFLISTGLEGLRLKMSLLATIKKKKNPGHEDEKLSRQTAAAEMKVVYLRQNLECQLQHRRQRLMNI